MQSVLDVVRSALHNEVKASAFYSLASETTNDDESRMVFLELMEMEEDHARELADKIKGTSLAEGFDPEAFINEAEARVEVHFKKDLAEILTNGDMRQVLQMAVEMETNAEEAYRKLAEHADNEDTRQFCEDQAKEEREHKNMLTRLLRSLDMDEEDRPDL